MKTAQLRQRFIDYFVSKGHQHLPSSSLIPADDPTLLFTNAGMVQFKDLFLGKHVHEYSRAVTSQRCVRAGGKHNDLENVGYTARHHTFFEMLGNFSFGDYFKEEAIHYAWDFLTKELKLPCEKLWITIYEKDDEAAKIWLDDIGVDPERFSRIGEKDNFWSMGGVGPCGPCSEIFYDHGEQYWGGPPGTADEDGDRYIEIWNLVFMQYNRDKSGNLLPLPKPSVDTGMGLERAAAVLQHVNNNYEIDLFTDLIKVACQITDTKDSKHHSVRVLADHIRSCAFLIADGILPSNEGRGYVLRRIIRRAIRHGYQLGAKTPFFYQLVTPLIAQMGSVYPELSAQQEKIENALKKEELKFAETLEQGLRIFSQKQKKLSSSVVPGELVFLLYDTYGFPVDLTADVAREKKLSLDVEGFEVLMEQQRTRARNHQGFSGEVDLDIDTFEPTEFVGYDKMENVATIKELYENDVTVDTISAEKSGLMILDVSPCYAEGGGQIGDCATVTSDLVTANISNCKKHSQGAYLHSVDVLSGTLNVGDQVHVTVDKDKRLAIMANHSATHLLHSALKNILGEHVHQKGSLVNAERLRFDFSHEGALTLSEINEVETWVNRAIFAQQAVTDSIMPLDEAKKMGAEALFGEKYTQAVRVLKMGAYSLELCGGTHVTNTSQVGVFTVIQETGVASGVRRIEALTRENALKWFNDKTALLNSVSTQCKVLPERVIEKVAQLQGQVKALQTEKQQLQKQLAQGNTSNWDEQIVHIGDIAVLAQKVDGYDRNLLKETIDELKQKHPQSIIVLAAQVANKNLIMAGVSDALISQYSAGALIKSIMAIVSGRGGGRADLAEGSVAKEEQITICLEAVLPWVRTQ